MEGRGVWGRGLREGAPDCGVPLCSAELYHYPEEPGELQRSSQQGIHLTWQLVTHPSGWRSKGYQEGTVLAEVSHRTFNKKRGAGFLTAGFSVLLLSRETIWCVSIEIQGIGNEAVGADASCFFFWLHPRLGRKKRGLGAILIKSRG